MQSEIKVTVARIIIVLSNLNGPGGGSVVEKKSSSSRISSSILKYSEWVVVFYIDWTLKIILSKWCSIDPLNQSESTSEIKSIGSKVKISEYRLELPNRRMKTRKKIFFNLNCDHGSIRNRFLINKQGLENTHRVGKCPNDLKDI